MQTKYRFQFGWFTSSGEPYQIIMLPLVAYRSYASEQGWELRPTNRRQGDRCPFRIEFGLPWFYWALTVRRQPKTDPQGISIKFN